MKDKPELAMRLAVRGMLQQKNTIAQWQLKRLKIYRGASIPMRHRSPKSGIAEKEEIEHGNLYEQESLYVRHRPQKVSPSRVCTCSRTAPVRSRSTTVTIDNYFGLETLKLIVRQPFAATDTMGKFDVESHRDRRRRDRPGGAIRHGIARALLQVEDSYRAPLKAAGLADPVTENERA